MTEIQVKNLKDLEKKAIVLLQSAIIAKKDFSFINLKDGNYTVEIGKENSDGCVDGESVEFYIENIE